MKDNDKIFFLFDNIKETIYKPYKYDEDSALYFDKENIYNKENLEKLNNIILNYRKEFKSYILKNSDYELGFDDKSMIIIDLLLSDFYKENFISELENELEIQKFISTWVGYLGSYLLYFIKKRTRRAPKILYPIYDSYFKFENEKVFPYFIAMKKLSFDENISIYEYVNDLISYINNEDFKVNVDYVDEVKRELRPHLVKWFLKN